MSRSGAGAAHGESWPREVWVGCGAGLADWVYCFPWKTQREQ